MLRSVGISLRAVGLHPEPRKRSLRTNGRMRLAWMPVTNVRETIGQGETALSPPPEGAWQIVQSLPDMNAVLCPPGTRSFRGLFFARHGTPPSFQGRAARQPDEPGQQGDQHRHGHGHVGRVSILFDPIPQL